MTTLILICAALYVGLPAEESTVPGFTKIVKFDVERDPGETQYRVGHSLLLKEEWDRAIAAFDSVQRVGGTGFADDAMFWKCHALERQDRKREAFDCYRTLLSKFGGGSKWADDAKQNLVFLAGELQLGDTPEFSAFVDSVARSLDDEIALMALHALTSSRDERGLDAAAALLKKTDDHRIRQRLTQLMGEYGSPKAFRLLKEVVAADYGVRVRIGALHSMTRLSQKDAELEAEVANYLESVTFQDYPWRLQENAIRARVTIGAHRLGPGDRDPKVADFLERVARTHESRRARSTATRHLAQRWPDRAIGLLDDMTVSADQDVQRQIVRLLAGLADGSGLDRLIEIAESHPSVTVRKDAIQALQRSEDPKARDALFRLATKGLD